MAQMKTKKKKIFKAIYVSGGGKEYDAGDWEVSTDTAKTLTLICIREPYFQQIDDKVLRIKKNNSGVHCLRDWEDGTFTVYPYRNGTPYYFEPKP